MKNTVYWNCIKPLLSDIYKNGTEEGGRPNFDPVFMVKIMFLQSLYGLVDEAMEICSNIRFMNFLDYPESVPDARTIWLFRESIASYYKDKETEGYIRCAQESIMVVKAGSSERHQINNI